MGYTTEKVAHMSTIHPSKRPRNSSEPSPSQIQELSSSGEEEKNSTDFYVAEESPLIKRKYHATKSAAKLLSKVSLSSRKASAVLQNLAKEGIERCTHTITIGNLASSDQGCRKSQEPAERNYW